MNSIILFILGFVVGFIIARYINLEKVKEDIKKYGKNRMGKNR